MEITIRTAREADFEQIVDLFKEFALFEKLPEKMINTVDKMLEEKELFNCFVAVGADGVIIGYATYFFSYHTWSGKCMYMDDLYVREPLRKKGIGMKLLQTIIASAKQTGCHKLRWQVSSWNNNAQEFYKSIGAEIDSIEMNCDLALN